MNPLLAVGRLRRWNPETLPNFPYLGTCFAYRWQNRFLTAAHCIHGIPHTEIAVESPSGIIQTATEVEFHPTADIAVIACGALQIKGMETDPFWMTVENWQLGEEIMAYGFPIDVFGEDASQPTPRVFRGYFQRFIPDYKAFSGYRYLAGEINFGCPAGLSGGPVFRPSAHPVVLGLATENLRSYTNIQSFEEVSIRSSSPSRTKSGSHPSARTLPSRRGSAGAVTTGRQNTGSSRWGAPLMIVCGVLRPPFGRWSFRR